MKYTIDNGSMPAVIFQLEAGESLFSSAGGRRWAKGPIVTENSADGGVKKVFGRIFSGESILMSHYIAQGPSEIAFTPSFPGRIIVRELQTGESLICQKQSFLCATEGVTLSAHLQKKLSTGLFGGEGFVMQRIEGPGLVFLELIGYSHEYELQAGETVVCETGMVALMDETCEMSVQRVKGAKNIFLGGEGLFDTIVTGPGKIYLQTMTAQKLANFVAPYLPHNSN